MLHCDMTKLQILLTLVTSYDLDLLTSKLEQNQSHNKFTRLLPNGVTKQIWATFHTAFMLTKEFMQEVVTVF